MSLLWLGGLLAVVCLGCASAGGTSTGSGTASHDPAHDRCRFLRIEYTESDRNVGSDSVVLTLVMTPPASSGHTAGSVSAKVLVHKERAVGLQAALEAQPHLMCEPEPGSLSTYRVLLPE